VLIRISRMIPRRAHDNCHILKIKDDKVKFSAALPLRLGRLNLWPRLLG
jgi:hypothetical protein